MGEPQTKATDKRLDALREELEAKAKECEATEKELEEFRQRFLHLQADFENAKRRWLKAQAESQEQAAGDILKQLLEIFDDFERASQAAGSADLQTLRQGIGMMGKRMESFLKSYGVTPMEAQGKPFDPHQHEAVSHETREDLSETTVIEELRKGYLMNGKVLRTAAVKVAVRKDSE